MNIVELLFLITGVSVIVFCLMGLLIIIQRWCIETEKDAEKEKDKS